MLLPGENSQKTWLFVTILVATVIALSESSPGKMLDFNIAFDLTHGGTGAPALRAKDFEGSTEFNPRAMDKVSDIDERISDSKNSKSSSEEQQPQPKKEEETKEKDKSDEEEEGGDDGGHDDDQVRITRGPKNNDFIEPEETPGVHAKLGKESDSDKNSDEDRRRYKRHMTHSVM